MAATHEVTNQPPPLTGHDVFDVDAAVVEAFDRYGRHDARPELHELGRLAGSTEAQEWAREADRYSPVLRTHDRYGNRVDEVEFHPSWHQLMDTAVTHGLHARPWSEPGSAAHGTRAAKFLVWSQLESAHLCPISMTYAAVPALRADPGIAEVWEPRLTSVPYDFGLRPPGKKTSVLAGMAMTEKQGGSDVRANTTRAEPAGDGWYHLTGHKWFCSAPMNDVFLMLAHTSDGLSCFLVPRVLDDGSRNPFAVQRLKDKLGNRANASAEIELDGTLGQRLGAEGRGVATIIDMVAATRLDCVLGSAALMRRAVTEATWHAAHRSAFGGRLADSALMRNVLADIAMESEAATALAMRLASTMDAPHDPHEKSLRRIGLPLAKYWVCKRAALVVAEAVETLGGNGYVEDSDLPRLYREAPLNSIWEGAGNVQALDLLRVLAREPDAVAAWRSEIAIASGQHSRLDEALSAVDVLLAEAAAQPDSATGLARVFVERMTTLLQASLLVRFAPDPIADAFCSSRLGGAPAVFGTLPAAADTVSIVRRATVGG